MMEIELLELENKKIAVLKSDKVELQQVQDALDLLGNCMYNDVYEIIIYKENISPLFFDLKTKLAGDILQKFSTYNFRMAIVGDFKNIESKSLKDFIFESNKAGRINFVESIESAIQCLN